MIWLTPNRWQLRLVGWLFAHDYADATPPTFRQARANHFDLWRHRIQQIAGHRVEAAITQNYLSRAVVLGWMVMACGSDATMGSLSERA
jgi:hypothetical protein